MSERVIFTDPGLDDAAAIKYLSQSPETKDTAVVSSYGNVSEQQSYLNISALAGIFRFPRGWKIIRGPSHPLDKTYTRYSDMAVYKGNGPDGLWGAQTPLRTRKPNASGNLEEMEVESINELISFAPLTGPVLLERGGAKPAKTLIMGGAFLEGNVRPITEGGEYSENSPRVSEWNFFKDANAAKEYFEKYAGLNAWVVTKDACMAALLSADSIITSTIKPRVDYRFMKRILRSWAVEYGKINPAVVKRGLMLSDLVAVISYKYPELANWEETGLEIVDKIGPDLGRSYRSKTNPTCRVAASIKEEQLDNLFEAINQTLFG